MLSQGAVRQETDRERQRLICRDILKAGDKAEDDMLITREKLAQMLMPFICVEPDRASCTSAESDRMPYTGGESGRISCVRDETDGIMPVSEYLRVAVEQGFLAKKGDGAYLPQGYITRQEMAIVLAKVLKLDTKNVTVTEKFEDDDKIADWAYNAVYACKNAGYLSGDGKNFDPTGSTDRGMAAVVLMQMDSAK